MKYSSDQIDIDGEEYYCIITFCDTANHCIRRIHMKAAPTIPIKHMGHVETLFDALGSMVNDPKVSDVQFHVDGDIVWGNSSILCSRSIYFEKMLNGNFSESKKRKFNTEGDGGDSGGGGDGGGRKKIVKKLQVGDISTGVSSSSKINSSVSSSASSSSVSEKSSSSSVLVVNIENTSSAGFIQVLHFLYTSKCELNIHALDVLELACRFDIIDLIPLVAERLSRAIDVSNVCSLWMISDIHSISKLKLKCYEFFVLQRPSIERSEGYLELQKKCSHLLKQCEKETHK